MNTICYVHWQDGQMWQGYLKDFPYYMTQGENADVIRLSLGFLSLGYSFHR